MAMHLLSASWLALIGAVCVVGIAALLWIRRRPSADLGSVSDSWIAEHATDGRRF
jgi:LPXTG-motif cell wall-anchored protein